MQTAAEAALKDLGAKEKKEVGLQERRKHASAKAKKLKKSLTDVSHLHSLMITDVNLVFAGYKCEGEGYPGYRRQSG